MNVYIISFSCIIKTINYEKPLGELIKSIVLYCVYFFDHYETRFHLDITAITISPGLLSIFSSSDKTPES